MKPITLRIILFAFLFAAFTTGRINAQPTASDFRKLSWLEGNWKRTNNKPGRNGEEYWTKLSETEWRGLGVTRRERDTLFVEKLKLITRDNKIYYVAEVKENKEPVYFQFTEISATGFVCENPRHDFPKKISYQLDGDKLKAAISGNGKVVDYLLIRIGRM